MQFRDVQMIRQRWVAKGSPSCDHTYLDDEYIMDLPTGDKVCLNCGRTFTPSELVQNSKQTGKTTELA